VLDACTNGDRERIGSDIVLWSPELGLEQPQTETLMAKFKERIKDRQVPEHAAKVINEEMVRTHSPAARAHAGCHRRLSDSLFVNQEKFQHLSPSSTEYNVVRTYLDWLTTLPWDTLTKDNLDMHHAESTLLATERAFS
jgi:ATP-dependent Lon protease